MYSFAARCSLLACSSPEAGELAAWKWTKKVEEIVRLHRYTNFSKKVWKKKKNRKRKKRETLSWHRKRWSKVTDVEGGQKPQQTTFLFLVILREIQNIFNPPSSCVSVSVCVEYVGGMPTLLDRVRVYNISRYRLRRFVFLFFISLFLIFYLYVWMRSVPARRKGGSTGRVCLCARGSCFVFQIYLAICFVYLSRPSFFFFLSFLVLFEIVQQILECLLLVEKAGVYSCRPGGGSFTFFFFFRVSCGSCLVCCTGWAALRVAFDLWTFFFFFFFETLPLRVCIALLKDYTYEHIQQFIYIYRDIYLFDIFSSP